MSARTFILMLVALSCRAEIHTMTLRETIARAGTQNPDVIIARLNEQIAAENVRAAHAPFTPRIIVGSGVGYSSGFPMSIEGSAPSIFQAKATQTIYNRPLSFQVAAARENARGAAIDADARRDEAAFRTASLYLDAERLGRQADLAAKQIEAFERVAEIVRARIQEGRELEIENKRASLNIAQARQRTAALRTEQETAESNLAITLGFRAEDRVRPAAEERSPIQVPKTAEEAVESALTDSKELRRLEAQLRAKTLEVQSGRAARYPQFELVAQYGLFAKFQNYEEFFRRFERHNGQIAVSIALPVLPGSGSSAEAARAELEMTRLRTELNSARERITVETRRSYQDVQNAETGREVARLDLEFARDQLGVLLSQYQEGRTGLRQIEEARNLETAKWMAFYDAQSAFDRARLNLLRQTGDIMAALK